MRRVDAGDGAWQVDNNQNVYAGDYTSAYYDYKAGLRFLNINIPKGAVIESAKLKLCASYTNEVFAPTIVKGEAADNPATFSTKENFDARPRTNASVNWQPSEWVTDAWYTSPDIKAIIQEIVNREGWAPGNALVIFWEDPIGWGGVNNYLCAYGYYSAPTKTAQLQITWSEPPEPPLPGSINLPIAEVVFGDVIPPMGDIVDLLVHLGCTNEVSSFECLLQNFDKKYSPGEANAINLAAATTIKIGRGANKPLILTGKVEDIRPFSVFEQAHGIVPYIRVAGRCVGEKLFRRRVTKTYEDIKGELIIQDLLINYVGLPYSIESTSTTYQKLEYEDTPVLDILKYIAATADYQGVIGYDFRIAPDGKFEFFRKNSKTSNVSLSERIDVLGEYGKNIYAIRNKITVYGAAERPEPLDKDSWTESLTNWTANFGSLDADTTYKKVGTYSVAGITADPGLGEPYRSDFQRSLPALTPFTFETLKMWIRTNDTSDNWIDILLLAPDNNNYFWLHFQLPMDTWVLKELPIGRKNEYDELSNPNGVWNKVGNPSWQNITAIRFKHQSTNNFARRLWVDMLHFAEGRWRGAQENTASQQQWTDGEPREDTFVDEELHSDNECALRAKALVDHLKDPAEYLTVRSTIIDYGDTPILPGDKIFVSLPNEKVDGYFRIQPIEYHVDGRTQTLEITLQLGREKPLLADYLYALRSKQDQLSRYKVAR